MWPAGRPRGTPGPRRCDVPGDTSHASLATTSSPRIACQKRLDNQKGITPLVSTSPQPSPSIAPLQRWGMSLATPWRSATSAAVPGLAPSSATARAFPSRDASPFLRPGPLCLRQPGANPSIRSRASRCPSGSRVHAWSPQGPSPAPSGSQPRSVPRPRCTFCLRRPSSRNLSPRSRCSFRQS